MARAPTFPALAALIGKASIARVPVVAAAFAVLLAGSVERTDADAPRCSIIPTPVIRAEATTILLGRAGLDTLEAGPGTVTRPGRDGHSGPVTPGPIYGQVVEIDRVGGFRADDVQAALERRGVRHVLVVPWDYDASCHPSRWTRGFRWVPPDEPATYTVTLRPDSLWIDGIPVLDAFRAVLHPYPLSAVYRAEGHWLRVRSTRTEVELTAAQFFDMMLAYPTAEEVVARPDNAWRAFSDWLRANPELADRYPATEAAERLASHVGHGRKRLAARSFTPVIAGTWLLSISLDAGPEREFYLRTHTHALQEWTERDPVLTVPDPEYEARRPEAYTLPAAGAPTLELLPVDCTTRDRIRREGYMYAIEPENGESSEWRGWFESWLIARQFPADTVLAGFNRRAFDEWSERWQATGSRETPARFHLGPSGTLHVEQTITTSDNRTLRLHGRRISDETITCDW
jgi:hypothetical protein